MERRMTFVVVVLGAIAVSAAAVIGIARASPPPLQPVQCRCVDRQPGPDDKPRCVRCEACVPTCVKQCPEPRDGECCEQALSCFPCTCPPFAR